MSVVPATLLAGRYELDGTVLAQGGMGVVVAGRDRALDRPVAVKLLAEHACLDPAAKRRFLREALAAARIEHPNAIKIFDAGDHDGRPFIVMERLPGPTLADEMLDGPLPVARARRIGRQVLSVLAQAHRLGIVHRDVKPHNVLIDEDGNARVGDFGIAKSIADDATRTRELLGTPAYVAPELFHGDQATPRSDLFSCGVMLYEAVTGRKPFKAETPLGVATAMQRGDFEPIVHHAPWVDAEFAAAVEVSLRPDPKDRFGSAGEMAAALDGQRSSSSERTRVLGAATTAGLERPDDASERSRSLRTLVGWPAAIALAIAVLATVAVLALRPAPTARTQPSPRPSPAPGSSLPASLEEALSDLERLVSR